MAAALVVLTGALSAGGALMVALVVACGHYCAERLSRFVSRDYTPTVNLSLNSYAATTHCAVDGVVVDVPSRK